MTFGVLFREGLHIAFSCHLFLSTAGTEAMFAHLGHFTATSIRVCATNERGLRVHANLCVTLLKLQGI